MQKASILRIDSQLPHGVLAVKLVGPARFRTIGLRKKRRAQAAWVPGCRVASNVLIHAGCSD